MLALFAEGGAVPPGQALEGFDDERRCSPDLLDLPRAAHETVDQELGPDPGRREEDLLAVSSEITRLLSARRAHQRRPDYQPLLHELRELLAPEVPEAGPQADVGRARNLGLEPGQALYCVKGGDSLPVEQHLSVERR